MPKKLSKQNIETMIQESENIKSKIQMIYWVSELIHEIDMIDEFFRKKQVEYRNEFIDLKNKLMRYQRRDFKENSVEPLGDR